MFPKFTMLGAALLGVAVAALVTTAPDTIAASVPPAVTVSVVVNSQDPIVTETPLFETGRGTYKFATLISDPRQNWTLMVSFNADPDVFGNAQLNGYAEFTNKTSNSLQVDIDFDIPLCPLALNSASIGGMTTVKLTMSADGGSINVPAGDALWTARVDQIAKKHLFDGPFELKGSGKGTAQTYYDFGNPMPGLPINIGASSFGLRHRFSITGSDKVRLTSLYVLGAPSESITDCAILSTTPGDLDGDGFVSTNDLGLLLGYWGSSEPTADLNGDGIVNGEDLGRLLGFWTG